ncbi:MAG: hypothetical protein OEN20_09770 [Gammaproteobacteria bacterium]|nr:hypothetical protein [Gammaproteobacteria bacterium]
MKNLFRIPAVLLLAMYVLGCGQSGPLYVTGNPSTMQPAAEQPTAEEEEEDSESAESDSE